MPDEIIDSLLRRAYLARRENRLNDGKAAFTAAVDASRIAGERRLLALAVAGLGHIESDLGNTDAAVRNFAEATDILRSFEEPGALAHTVRHLGDIHRRRSEFTEAAACYEEALGIYRRDARTSPLDLANAVRGYALLKGTLGERAQAVALWEEAGALYATVGVDPGVTESKARIAKLNG